MGLPINLTIIEKTQEVLINPNQNKKYLIINYSEVDKIDFSKVLETSIDTLRKSVDGTKTFIKWEGDTPEFINNFNIKEGPYSYEQITNILSTNIWNNTIVNTPTNA